MVQKFKPIIKQLLIAAIILVSVTVLSFGIRLVRFSIYQADTSEPTSSSRQSETEYYTQPEQHLDVKAESEYDWEDSYIADTEHDPQDAKESFWDEQTLTDEYTKAKTDMGKKDNAFTKDKLFKDDYAKANGSKDLDKISLSDHEELYFSGEGEYWYVSKQPDGKTVKMQVEIINTGELIAVGGGYYAKQEPQRITLSDNEDIYLTDEGEVWYVSEQSNGETVKVQVPTN
jgi:hypothetical protein